MHPSPGPQRPHPECCRHGVHEEPPAVARVQGWACGHWVAPGTTTAFLVCVRPACGGGGRWGRAGPSSARASSSSQAPRAVP